MCGQAGPEDLVAVPGSAWLIASAYGADGGLNLIDTKAAVSTRLYPSADRDGAPRHEDLRFVPGPAAGRGPGEVPNPRPLSETGPGRAHALRRPSRQPGIGRGLRARRSTKTTGRDVDRLRRGAGSDRSQRRRRAAGRRLRRVELRSAPARRCTRRFFSGAARRAAQRRAVGMAYRTRMDEGAGERSGRRQRTRNLEGRQVVLRGRVGQPVVHASVARPDAGQARRDFARLPCRQRAVGARRLAAGRRPGRRGRRPWPRRRGSSAGHHIGDRESGSEDDEVSGDRQLPDQRRPSALPRSRCRWATSCGSDRRAAIGWRDIR